MRISKDFIIRKIAGEHVVVPTGKEALKFQGLITVNEVGTFLWEMLQTQDRTMDELLDAVCDEYEADRAEAEKDIGDFLEKIRREGILLE